MVSFRLAVFVAATLTVAAPATTPDTVRNVTRLQAIIIADIRYLDSVWGQSKMYDPAYRPIEWPVIN